MLIYGAFTCSILTICLTLKDMLLSFKLVRRRQSALPTSFPLYRCLSRVERARKLEVVQACNHLHRKATSMAAVYGRNPLELLPKVSKTGIALD